RWRQMETETVNKRCVQEELYSKYPEARAVTDEIEQATGLVLTDVDARRLGPCVSLSLSHTHCALESVWQAAQRSWFCTTPQMSGGFRRACAHVRPHHLELPSLRHSTERASEREREREREKRK